MLIPFLSFLIQSTTFKTKYDELAVMHFFYFVRNDTLLATHVEVDDHKITFHLQTGEVAVISQYKELIRRQVDHKGHEVYLRNTKNMTVERTPFGFHIIITTVKGDKYEKVFTFYE